jgi:DNA modification methylase
MTATLLCGDVRPVLASLPDGSVQTCVTSPPYFGLRDYGHEGQLGLEPTPDAYVAAMVAVFREVRRVLRDDGTLWLNLGDSYAGSGRGVGDVHTTNKGNGASRGVGSLLHAGLHEAARESGAVGRAWVKPPEGYKQKDLLGIPWLVAFALRADGWYLRSDIIWAKPNPMPESVTDRPTKAHEYVFLLTKSARYYYDAAAIAEPITESSRARLGQPNLENQMGSDRVPGKTNGNMKAVGPRFGGSKYGDHDAEEHRTKSGNEWTGSESRNARTVWTIATQPYSGAHFATMPEELARRCILAGSSAKACEHCGAPWERVTERREVERADCAIGGDPARQDGGTRERVERLGGGPNLAVMRVGTDRFAPTCACEGNTGLGKGVVLDPFGGSGTTAAVAVGHGRSAIHIDLNPAYIELARTRIGPMLCTEAA